MNIYIYIYIHMYINIHYIILYYILDSATESPNRNVAGLVMFKVALAGPPFSPLLFGELNAPWNMVRQEGR